MGLEFVSYIVMAGIGFAFIGLLMSIIELMSKNGNQGIESDYEEDEDLNALHDEDDDDDDDDFQPIKEKKKFGFFGSKKNKDLDEDEEDDFFDAEDEEEDDDDDYMDEDDDMIDDFKKKMEEKEREREQRRIMEVQEENERKVKLREELGRLQIKKYSDEDEIELPNKRESNGEDEEDEILKRLKSYRK